MKNHIILTIITTTTFSHKKQKKSKHTTKKLNFLFDYYLDTVFALKSNFITLLITSGNVSSSGKETTESSILFEMIRNGSRLSLPSIDSAPLPILSSPEYGLHNPQLDHIFIDSQYFSEPWHADSFMNVSQNACWN
jgi:hypothetical protein